MSSAIWFTVPVLGSDAASTYFVLWLPQAIFLCSCQNQLVQAIHLALGSDSKRLAGERRCLPRRSTQLPLPLQPAKCIHPSGMHAQHLHLASSCAQVHQLEVQLALAKGFTEDMKEQVGLSGPPLL